MQADDEFHINDLLFIRYQSLLGDTQRTKHTHNNVKYLNSANQT